jgi:hypothetical protein
MAVKYKLNINPLPKQAMAIKMLMEDGVDELLFGGSAGSGKSMLDATLAPMFCLQYPGITVNVMGTTKDSIIQTVGKHVENIAPDKVVDPKTGVETKI